MLKKGRKRKNINRRKSFKSFKISQQKKTRAKLDCCSDFEAVYYI